MDDSVAVRLVERVRDLRRIAQRLVDRQAPAREAVAERLAFEQLHHQEADAVLLTDVVQRADVRVVQAGDGAGLTLEALAQIWIGREMLGQHFDRDEAIEPAIARSVDLAHAARAKWRHDLVWAERGTGRQRHGRICRELYRLWFRGKAATAL